MSIPLDRLYHYIESVAHEVCSDSVLIYRFYPHGLKNLKDLTNLTDSVAHNNKELQKARMQIQIFCYDQEPLNFKAYQNITVDTLKQLGYSTDLLEPIKDRHLDFFNNNLRSVLPIGPFNIYDKCVLLHSEKRSFNLKLYQNSQYVPAYYWSHAVIALDWFRYAKHTKLQKNQQLNTFLIYNRAWSGTREYRLKFADLLIDHQLVDDCQTTVGFYDNQTHYSQHNFINQHWQPRHQLEAYYKENQHTSCNSADFNLDDYNSTVFEVVLETLFDDGRLQLTEKVLRPIALGQPFILCSTADSLKFLREYGFKTFDSVFDEQYDTIANPYERLHAVVHLMKEITRWDPNTRSIKMQQIQEIVNYNKQHFFSKEFFDQVNNELRLNLMAAINEVEENNTCDRYFNLRKSLATVPELRNYLTQPRDGGSVDRTQIVEVVKKARSYYTKIR
jgi:hypothetical protein